MTTFRVIAARLLAAVLLMMGGLWATLKETIRVLIGEYDEEFGISGHQIEN